MRGFAFFRAEFSRNRKRLVFPKGFAWLETALG
jgi:hypothetical protein